MAEAIDSSLFFSVPTGWMQQYKIGVFGVLYGWNREFRESEHNARERYPGGHLPRRDRENSKLYFCAHKRGNSLPRGQGIGRNFDRNQERQKASFSSRLYARERRNEQRANKEKKLNNPNFPSRLYVRAKMLPSPPPEDGIQEHKSGVFGVGYIGGKK